MRARAVMVWGTSSGAGKSWLATALCRWAARQGIDVAPFKAQNMSNNARVVAGLDGHAGEIGAAQYFQALAARVVPSVDMNPVLLKPEHDRGSQVVVHGRVDTALSRQGWRERSGALAQAAQESLSRLQGAHELLVIEGAGSPAETNLADVDYVNLETARWSQARSLLVTDIDRGGAFAHLLGTWTLLPDDLRPTVAGFVLNKFRGDPALLAPAPQELQQRTGVPTLAVLPMVHDHGLPDEDGWFMRPSALPGVRHPGAPAFSALGTRRVAVVAYPRLSNLDEFEPLQHVPGVRLNWARSPSDLEGADWIVLPGSKQVSGDLAWLRTQGLDAAIRAHAAGGRPLLGICGGMQMLGERLHDPDGHDGAAVDEVAGLGLLPLVTHYTDQKRTRRATLQFGRLSARWAALAGLAVDGYEIRQGQTQCLHSETASTQEVLWDAQGTPIGWQRDHVLGLYAHGLFESTAVLHALFGNSVPTLDSRLDRLADLVDRHFETGALQRLLVR
jgi:adenosylcobyric acid synthase